MTDFHRRYVNTYDPSKDYKKLLFLGGRGLQTNELMIFQEIIRNELLKLGNYLIKSGTLIEGGVHSSLSESSVTLSQASIYADGSTYNVPAATLNLLTGVNVVGIMIKETVITELEDPDIYQSDPLSPNIGHPGAYRLKVVGQWTVSSLVPPGSKFFPIYTFSGGNLLSSSISTESDKEANQINSAIEEYDDSTNGSYILDGLELKYINKTSSDFNFSISAGKARVTGRLLNHQFNSAFSIPQITDTRNIPAEPMSYGGPGAYSTRYPNIQAINSISVIVEVTETVTHGTYATSADLLGNIPVVLIKRVWQDATEFVPGTDVILNGDSVDWDTPSANKVAPGSSYRVTYHYMYTFIPDILEDKIIIPPDLDIVPNSVMYVNYNHYLSRIDRVSILRSGEIKVTKGIPSQRNPQIPGYTSNALSLGYILLSRSANPVITPDTVKLVNMSDMKEIISDLSDIKYNIAMLSLLEDAKQMDPTTNKRKVIVDPLKDTDMFDLGLSNNCAVVDETLTLDNEVVYTSVVNGMIALPHSEVVSVEQTEVTGYRKINPYAIAVWDKTPSLSVVPAIIYANTWQSNFLGDFLPRDQSYTVDVVGFIPNEQVEFKDINGNIAQVVTCDINGGARASLVLPVNTRTGTYPILVTGRTSGVSCKGSIVLRLSPSMEKGIYATWGEIPVPRDPIAQTITFNEEQEITSISVTVKELPTADLEIRLVNTVAGMPNREDVLSIGRLAKSSVIAGINKIPLKTPLRVIPDKEYAIILVTANSMGTVAVAKIGGVSSVTGLWVTSQTNNGVLLISANESTWTPVQDEDLTFKVYKAVYSSQNTSVIANFTVSNGTIWRLVGTLDQHDSTSVEFELTDISTGNKYPLVFNGNSSTPPISGNVRITATLKTSNPSVSPRIMPGMVISVLKPVKPGVYTQRAFSVDKASTNPAKIRLFIDKFEPSGSSITPSLELLSGVFSPMNLVSTRPVGFGYIETEYSLDNITREEMRLRLVLDTNNLSSVPSAKKIRLLVE